MHIKKKTQKASYIKIKLGECVIIGSRPVSVFQRSVPNPVFRTWTADGRFIRVRRESNQDGVDEKKNNVICDKQVAAYSKEKFARQ